MQAPGASPGTTFDALNVAGPSISPTGQVVFTSQLSGGASPFGVWTGDSPGNLTPVALVGQQAPGTASGVVFTTGDISPPRNVNSQIAAVGLLGGPGVNGNNDEGIWVGQPSISSLLVREGSPAPLPGGLQYGSLVATFSENLPSQSDSGRITFQTGLQDSGGNPIAGAADFSAQGTTITPLAFTGGAAPGLPAGSTITSLGSPGISPGNIVFFPATYNNPSGPIVNGSIIYGENFNIQPVSPSIVAQSGGIAPNMGAGVTFQNVSYVSTADGTNVHVNSIGHTVFFGTVTGPGITPGVNDQGVWEAGIGTSFLVARTGVAAPDVPGATFSSFADVGISIERDAVLAQIAGPGVTGDNNMGIWTGLAGSLHLSVRDGDVVSDGLNPPLVVSNLSHFAMAGVDDLVFESGTGAATVILGEDSLNHIVVIARPGDVLEVAPGDFRTIASVELYHGGETGGGPTPIDNQNQVGFSATFTDGSSGIFISNALTAPEPSTLILAAFGGLALVACRHWHARRA
ncbi:MAG TPA: choice-of-anchor tandem repeat NxxGxxAF-containing protein [Pirellulales bacterium]